jgi:hypothetical protein
LSAWRDSPFYLSTMQFLYNVLNHLQPVRQWAKIHGVRVLLDAETFALSLLAGDLTVRLQPRFLIALEDGSKAYTSYFSSRCRFVGWLPYRIKRWSLASDKLVFKRWCAERGLLVPDGWQEARKPQADYLVKPVHGSFGRGIRGPFRAATPPGPLASGAQQALFCEQFIAGRPAKIWFWNAQPVAMEMVEPPAITGDGLRSIAQMLATPRGNFDLAYRDGVRGELLAWQGLDMNSIPAAGQVVLLDFLYATPFDRAVLQSRDSLATQSPGFLQELARAGRLLHAAIPAGLRDATLFTVDAVLDDRDQCWLLEMNSHTVVHPRTYPAMLDELLLGQSAGVA